MIGGVPRTSVRRTNGARLNDRCTKIIGSPRLSSRLWRKVVSNIPPSTSPRMTRRRSNPGRFKAYPRIPISRTMTIGGKRNLCGSRNNSSTRRDAFAWTPSGGHPRHPRAPARPVASTRAVSLRPTLPQTPRQDHDRTGSAVSAASPVAHQRSEGTSWQSPRAPPPEHSGRNRLDRRQPALPIPPRSGGHLHIRCRCGSWPPR